MDKPKKWQLILIAMVMLLTFYNIAPTLLYYTKPLKSPLSEKQAYEIASEASKRVNSLNEFSHDWLTSFCKNLKIHPKSMETLDSGIVKIIFASEKDATVFKQFLPEAGMRIMFPPAQLSLAQQITNDSKDIVYVRNNVHFAFNQKSEKAVFSYVPFKKDNSLNPDYLKVVNNRASNLAFIVEQSNHIQDSLRYFLQSFRNNPKEVAIDFCSKLKNFTETFGDNSKTTQRLISSFSEILIAGDVNKTGMIIDSLNKLDKERATQKLKLLEEQKNLEATGSFLSDEQQDLLRELNYQESLYSNALAFFKNNQIKVGSKNSSITREKLEESLLTQQTQNGSNLKQVIALQDCNPFFSSIEVDLVQKTIALSLHEDLAAAFDAHNIKSEKEEFFKQKAQQFVYNEVASLNQKSNENINPSVHNTFSLSLCHNSKTSSYLVANLAIIAQERADNLSKILMNEWNPKHPDLQKNVFTIQTLNSFKDLSDENLGLYLYVPAQDKTAPVELKSESIYIFAKGLRDILQKYNSELDTEEGKLFQEDIESLEQTLQREGLVSYPGHLFQMPKELQNDYIFELNRYYQYILTASREDFQIKGNQTFAYLELSDLEDRIYTVNKILDEQQEELLKSKDDYLSALASQDPIQHYLVPPITRNLFWENFKISMYKYFHGDINKVLKWGLDLAGGKSVRIGLSDQNNKIVTAQHELEQGVNELTQRVNKMGVSEVEVVVEGDAITLNFPGSQQFSAQELIKSSSMTFHVVNEKFSPGLSMKHNELKQVGNRFLQEVWNEGLVTNNTSSEALHTIALKHLGGDLNGVYFPHYNADAKILYDAGLRLAKPDDATNDSYDDSLSRIVRMRGNDPSEWHGQSHPLMVIFHHYALEGSSLENIHSEYHASQGNSLVFSVRDSYGKQRSGSPRNTVYSWTQPFSQETIASSSKGDITGQKGWRMAIVLNGSIITSPSLHQPLMINSQITGNFTQSEVQKLASDLKAGSLTYTPTILTERNISPDLGQQERVQGIVSSIIGLVLVAACMIWYYRFAGVIATIAVLFNLLIIWGVLQNLGAALTLPGIAGIVLTIGMAVDANVLVFERIREELANNTKLTSAIRIGYQKAFTAIFDSNITTIIAALILIQFDAGPIKAFAVTLIIGIASSMFTALFMTKYFFSRWVQNPLNKELKMLNLIKSQNFDFLKKGKIVSIVFVTIIVIGSICGYLNKTTIMGMDFTGGYSVILDLKEQPQIDYREEVQKAFLKSGAQPKEFHLRELNSPNIVRVQFATSLDLPGHAFGNCSEDANSRLNWVIDALNRQNLELRDNHSKSLEQSWVKVSSQLSETTKYNAIWGLGLALISILIYISVRFEFKFALSSILCLLHDLLITLAALGILNVIGIPLQIDLQIIGALMTIIGYSLNDIIIIFDRIREDSRLNRKLSLKELANQAINKTISRTLMTSITTLLVLIALSLFGGASIFAFSFTMFIGIFLGTLSSIFVAPLLLTILDDRKI